MKKGLLITFLILSIFGLNSQTLIKDIQTGPQSSMPVFIDSVGNGFLFYGTGTHFGREIYFSNGTGNGTYLLKDIYDGANSSNCDFSSIKMNGNVYFFARDSSKLQYGLWKTDGTIAGTIKIKSITNETYPQNLRNNQNYAIQMAAFKNRLYMTIKDVNGYELWVSDGTDTGTYLLKDILKGTASSNPRGYKIYKDHLYFIAGDIDHGTELWRTDGTKDGTVLFCDIFPGSPSGFNGNNPFFFIIGDNLYFKGQKSYYEGEELWVTDGTLTGTRLFKDFNTKTNTSSNLKMIAQNDDYVLISTVGMNNTNQLWKFDGTDTSSFSLVISISGSVLFLDGINFGNKIVFPAFVNNFGYEYWITDGTDSGTYILSDINPGNSSSYVGLHAINGNRLYMVGMNSNSNLDVWTTDGTQDSTYIAFDLSPGVFQNNLTSFFTFRKKIYAGIMISSSTYGVELYRFETNKLLGLNGNSVDNMNFFPNPVIKGAYLNVPVIKEEGKAMIIDMNGRLTSTLEIENGKILIPNDISSGIYTLSYVKDGHIYNLKISITE